jgi:hypothetical protein
LSSTEIASLGQSKATEGHGACCCADKAHLKAGGPAGTDRNQGFCGADGKVGGQRNDYRGDESLDPMHTFQMR